MKRDTTRAMMLYVCAALLLAAGPALGDSLSVTSAAGMGGTAQSTCTGDSQPGPCGLEVFHDNSSTAFVEDLSPDAESVYRFEFLFRAEETTTTSNFRQTIVRAIGANPRPGVGSCHPTFTTAGVFRIFYYRTGGSGQNASILAWATGNSCGERSLPARIPINMQQNYRVCGELTTGNSLTGQIALAVVDGAQPCPASGDPSYLTRALTNNLLSIDRIRLGTSQTNNQGAGETATLYFDEFASFRTLAP